MEIELYRGSDYLRVGEIDLVSCDVSDGYPVD